MTVLGLSPTRSRRVARGAVPAGWKGASPRGKAAMVTFYLWLEWLDDPPPFTPEWRAALARVGARELQPGKPYSVRVRFLHRPVVGTSEAIDADSDLALALDYLAAPGSAEPRALTIAPDQSWDVPLNEVRKLSKDFILAKVFTLTVAPDCCEQMGILYLNCFSFIGQEKVPVPIHEHSVELRLAGSYRDEISRSLRLNLDQVVPASYIMVHAIESEDDKLSVIGFHGYDRKYPDKPHGPVPRPDKALARLIEAWKDSKKMLDRSEFEKLTGNVWNEVQEFSRKLAPKLLDWLFKLIEDDRSACVVITDYTRFEIPWELIEVSHDQPLGAFAPVARWTLVDEYASTEEQSRRGDPNEGVAGPKEYVRELRIGPETRIGSAVTYFDSSLLDFGHPLLESPLAERCTDMQKLLKCLKDDIAGVCLVYFHCHGEFDADEFRKTSVGPLWAINFEGILPKDQARPLFFVNACHSGRVTWDGGQAYGLAEALLARVACGYIGTLGPVEEQLATEVATALLNKAIAGPLNPAEALRALRQEALEGRKKNRADQRSTARFLNAFMYVYYGNPLASFKLELPPAPGGGS